MEGQARRCHHTQATVISPLKLVPSILQNSVKVYRNKKGHQKHSNGAVKLMRTRIRLLAQPKSMRSIIDATEREQRHGSA